jgi:hypothetical protein
MTGPQQDVVEGEAFDQDSVVMRAMANSFGGWSRAGGCGAARVDAGP